MASVILYAGIFGGGGLILALIIFLIVRSRSKGNKYPFLLYSSDGLSRTTVHAIIKRGKNNREDRRFVFKTLGGINLPIVPPSVTIDKVPYREIAFNDLGDINYLVENGIKTEEIERKIKEGVLEGDKIVRYIDKTRIDKSKYHDLSLKVEDKQITLHHLKQNQDNYQNPMNKMQTYMMIGGFLLIFFILVGIVFSTIVYSNNIKKFVEFSKEEQKVSADLVNVANQLKVVGEYMAASSQNLATCDSSLNRQIT